MISDLSQDAIVRCFDSQTAECLGVYRGHSAAVSDLCTEGDFVFSSAHDGTVKTSLHHTPSSLSRATLFVAAVVYCPE